LNRRAKWQAQAAERLATRASRRGFLGQLGKGALAVAGVLSGVLAFPGRAQAGTRRPRPKTPRGRRRRWPENGLEVYV
jgi:hypothetical protein